MKKDNRISERGQSLVLVTLMLLGMVAMLALVLDGGNVYAQRRQAQAAADAGALAAARANCDPDVELSPESEANVYVNNNYANLKSFSLGPGENEVTVETFITFETFFLSILGRSDLTVEAIASAKCEPGGGASVLPVAWSCRPPDFGEGDPGVECNLELDPDNTDCTYPSENPDDFDVFYVVIDSDDMDETVYCAEEYHEVSCPDIDCDLTPDHPYCITTYPICDLNCDGTLDLKILAESSFGWMDLDGGGSDANELKEWILDPESGGLVQVHHWYAGNPGVQGTVYDTVGDNLIGKEVIVPVFDHFCHGVPGDSNLECEWHPRDSEGEDVVIESGGTFDDYFHIIGFANYKVTCVDHSYHGPCEINQYLEDTIEGFKNVKTIEGCFVKGVSPDIVGAGGGDFDAFTLVLTR